MVSDDLCLPFKFNSFSLQQTKLIRFCSLPVRDLPFFVHQISNLTGKHSTSNPTSRMKFLQSRLILRLFPLFFMKLRSGGGGGLDSNTKNYSEYLLAIRFKRRGKMGLNSQLYVIISTRIVD